MHEFRHGKYRHPSIQGSAAREAETAVYRGLGIIQDGEEVTELAMAEIAAMRMLFKVGSPEDDALRTEPQRRCSCAGL